jgi:hypothetical protein
VRFSAHCLQFPGEGFQRPQEPPRARGHCAAAVVFGAFAVTVTVTVAVLVLFGVVLGFAPTVTKTLQCVSNIFFRKLESL